MKCITCRTFTILTATRLVAISLVGTAKAQVPPVDEEIFLEEIPGPGGIPLKFFLDETLPIQQFHLSIVGATWDTPSYVDLLQATGAVSDRIFFLNMNNARILFGSDDEQGNL